MDEVPKTWACFVCCIMKEAKSSNILYYAVSFIYIYIYIYICCAPAEECVACYR